MLMSSARKKRREALARKKQEIKPLNSPSHVPNSPPPASAPPPPLTDDDRAKPIAATKQETTEPVQVLTEEPTKPMASIIVPIEEPAKPVASIMVPIKEPAKPVASIMVPIEEPSGPVASILIPTTTIPATAPDHDDAVTVHTSGNARRTPTKKKSNKKNMTIEDQLEHVKLQVQQEKAGKRKIFHSLVKLANELRKTRTEALPALQQYQYLSQHWYDGGLWRSPELLPMASSSDGGAATTYRNLRQEPISLFGLFFNFIVLIAWTRVVVVAGSIHLTIDDEENVDHNNTTTTSRVIHHESWLLYLAILWSVWCKQTAYATRFDMTDLSGQAVTATTGIAILLSCFTKVVGSINSDDGDRVMMLAASVAVLHVLLHIRVAICYYGKESTVLAYAVFSILMNLLEAVTWIVGLFALAQDWEYRWAVFLGGILLSLRVPRGVLANDFQAYCSQRNVLVFLLLGFILQNIIAVANDFLSFRAPSWEEYSFLTAICIILLSIQFLYVDDADTVTMDHALIVNSWTGFFFHIGHFALMICITGLGVALSTLTHGYFRGHSSVLARLRVSESFAATLLAIFFLNSLHVKRVPSNQAHRAVFVTCYVVQALVIATIVCVVATMQFGYLEDVTNLELVWLVAATAIVVVVLSWTDEIAELSLYMSGDDARAARTEPLTFWCCLTPRTKPSGETESESENDKPSSLTPLLSIKEEGYQSVDESSVYGNVSEDV